MSETPRINTEKEFIDLQAKGVSQFIWVLSDGSEISLKMESLESWERSLQKFCLDMLTLLTRCVPEKGAPTKKHLATCSREYLVNKLNEHLEIGNYEDVANFAFLLRQKTPLTSVPNKSEAKTGGQ